MIELANVVLRRDPRSSKTEEEEAAGFNKKVSQILIALGTGAFGWTDMRQEHVSKIIENKLFRDAPDNRHLLDTVLTNQQSVVASVIKHLLE